MCLSQVSYMDAWDRLLLIKHLNGNVQKNKPFGYTTLYTISLLNKQCTNPRVECDELLMATTSVIVHVLFKRIYVLDPLENGLTTT